MTPRADAHIHLFDGGYRGSFAARPGVTIDEPALYNSLALEHGVKSALVIGYEGEPWCAGNNDHIAALAERFAWVRPVAYIDPSRGLKVEQVEGLASKGFVGISLYIFSDAAGCALSAFDDQAWRWLADRSLLISVNTRGEFVPRWRAILDRHPMLRVMFSHLALPTRVSAPPTDEQAAATQGALLALASYPQTHVKISGLYALTDPAYDYPHRSAWPYIATVLRAYGPERLLWGSDFSPCLDGLTFPQTLGVFSAADFLDAQAVALISGGNLLRLLGESRIP